ncbi:MAG: FAD-dependent tricarballylate dehydrogenase TcuA [Saprospiraceae bacterium]
MKKYDVIVVGAGNAALCAGIAALEKGASVLMIEKANEAEMGGNSRYTAGAMRFVYNSKEDLLPLLKSPEDERIPATVFGAYTKEKFQADLLAFNEGYPLSAQQHTLINKSYETIKWLASHGIQFDPIYTRQSFKRDGKYIFWGGLTLEAEGEGVGLIEAELATFIKLGGDIRYECAGEALIVEQGRVQGVECLFQKEKNISLYANAVILGCGGFEANPALRAKYIGEAWAQAKVRGTPHNTGKGIEMATAIGAAMDGIMDGCHAVPMDLNMPDNGNMDIPYIERKLYRKISYFLGVMLNAYGERFVDEGMHFRNYTYAQFGRELIKQPQGFGWQVFDHQVEDLLYSEYRFWDASFVEANTLEELVEKLAGVDAAKALATLHAYNAAVDNETTFDPSILDGKSTHGLSINKTNWANKLDTPPFKAFPVTCGITFTYGGLKTDCETAAVLDENNAPIPGLFACGELVGNVFYYGYPGGAGLTSGAVFGRLAGFAAVQS